MNETEVSIARTFAESLVHDCIGILREAREEARNTATGKMNATDVVTLADKRAEAYLVEQITRQYPTHAILGEEGASFNETSDYRWVLDPLDGTLNYVRGIAAFGPIVSLEHNGVPIVGVSADVTTATVYSAGLNQGTTCNTKAVHVSSTETLSSAVVIIEGATDEPAQQVRFGFAEALVGRIGATRQIGSCATEFGLVASGAIDAVIANGGGRWDFSAGAALVREAGGRFIGRQDPDGRYTFLTSNAALFDELAKLLDFQEGNEFI